MGKRERKGAKAPASLADVISDAAATATAAPTAEALDAPRLHPSAMSDAQIGRELEELGEPREALEAANADWIAAKEAAEADRKANDRKVSALQGKVREAQALNQDLQERKRQLIAEQGRREENKRREDEAQAITESRKKA
jgi:hypothetical protein